MRLARCVAAVACVLVVAGCGGPQLNDADGSQGPADTSSTPTLGSDPTEPVSPTDPVTTTGSSPSSDADAARIAFEQWVDAYVRSDGPAACALQTDEYTKTDLQQSIDSGVISAGTSCEDGVVAGAALARAFGFEFADPSIKPTSVHGDKVTLAVKFQGAPREVFVMTRDDGKWLVAQEIGKAD